jgi:outer membrane lipoprotein-sorting protein
MKIRLLLALAVLVIVGGASTSARASELDNLLNGYSLTSWNEAEG